MRHCKYKKYFSEAQIYERLFSLSLFLNFKDLTCRKDKQTIGKGNHPFRPLGMTEPLLLLTRLQECLTIVVLANLLELIGEEFFVEPLLVLLP